MKLFTRYPPGCNIPSSPTMIGPIGLVGVAAVIATPCPRSTPCPYHQPQIGNPAPLSIKLAPDIRRRNPRHVVRPRQQRRAPELTHARVARVELRERLRPQHEQR